MLVDLDNESPTGDIRGRTKGGLGERTKENLGEILSTVVGCALGVDPVRLTGVGRGDARTAFARQVAIYLACTRFGLSFTAAGRLFGRDRTTAAYACRRVEERRDDARTDELVDRLDRTIDLFAGRWAARRPGA